MKIFRNQYLGKNCNIFGTFLFCMSLLCLVCQKLLCDTKNDNSITSRNYVLGSHNVTVLSAVAKVSNLGLNAMIFGIP